MNISYNKVVGGKIKFLRELRGLSLRNLAEDLKIPYPSLSKIEKGEQKIDMDLLMNVADYFQLSVNNLLTQDEKSFEQPSYAPVISMPIHTDLHIKAKLEYVLNHYLSAKKEPFEKHSMGNHIKNELTKTLEKEVPLDKKRYSTKGSIGQSNNWAWIPWLSIFINDITTVASKGYYIVFLFKADMTGFYLSLNQGWSYFENKYEGLKEARSKIKRTAALVREKLNTVPDHLKETEINLASTEKLAKGYESGHIYGRYYSMDSLYSSEEIINDVHFLLLAYREIEKWMDGRPTEQFNDYLLLEDDNNFLEKDELEEKYQKKAYDFITINTIDTDDKDTEEARDRPNPIVDKGGSTRWPRNAKTAAKALERSDYKCSYNSNHETFISKVTGKPFMELHHLVPMSLQYKIESDLDRVVNIKSLCPLCHRAIHHGEDTRKSTMIEQLYKSCHDDLEKVGIKIALNDLKEAYGIK